MKHPVQFLSDSQLGEFKEALSIRDNQKIQARERHNEWLGRRGKKRLPDYDELECPHADYLTPLARLILQPPLLLILKAFLSRHRRPCRRAKTLHNTH